MHNITLLNHLYAFHGLLDDAIASGKDDVAPSARAAVSILLREPGQSIAALADRIGLSHSATVRLVDGLERRWLVRRGRMAGREVQVTLTANGRRMARQIAEARNTVLGAHLAALSAEEQAELGRLLSAILSAAPDKSVRAAHWCRYCDTNQCDIAGCPTTAR